MLLDKKVVLDMLRCPKSGSKLIRIDNKLIAESSDGKIEYPIIKGFPVMIDFDKSIFKKENIETLSSIVDRHSYSGLLNIFRRLISHPIKSTTKNVDSILNLLLQSKNSPQVLIIGGGAIGQGMEPFYHDPRIALISFDVYASPHIQFLADAHNIPLHDQSFDAVIIQAVLEHVLEPITVVSEIYRLLKPEGIVYAETPFLQQVHEGAYDFTRFTESGHRFLFNDFELLKSGSVSGSGTQLLWSLDYFFRGLFRSRKFGTVIKLCFFWLQYLDKLIPESYNIDAASGVYFLGKKKMSGIEPTDIINHYKGAQIQNP